MASRTFTVFKDSTPIEPPHTNQKSAKPPVLARLSTTSTNPEPTVPPPIEKENLHSLTGQRTGNASSGAKKRKTTVLSTKLHTPPDEKESKTAAQDSQPESKKRKSTATSSATSSSATSATASSKSRQVMVKKLPLSTVRKVTVTKKRSTRRIPTLPKVVEEPSSEIQVQAEQQQQQQQTHSLRSTSGQDQPKAKPTEKPKARSTTREPSPGPGLRDYYAPSLTSTTTQSTSTSNNHMSSKCPSSSVRPTLFEEKRASSVGPAAAAPGGFSTPERKQIYAAFTFRSPSPTSERYGKGKATRAASMPPLELEPLDMRHAFMY